MKMNFFKGFRTTISNIAQIILVVLLLPAVAIIIGSVSGANTAGNISGFLSSLVGNIPLCDIWVDILYQYKGGLEVEDVLSSTLLVILKALPEALISALCVYAAVQVSKKLKSRGLPIFATFIGIAIASIITSLTGLSGSMTTEIIIDFGVVIIMFIGLRFMLKSVFRKMNVFSLKKILLFFIDGLFAVITTAYISGLIMAASGVYSSTGETIRKTMIITGIEIFAAVGVGVINFFADKDETVF